MKRKDLDSLLDAIDHVLVRIRCGNTLLQAVEGMPPLKADAQICSEWCALRDRILNGEIPAESLASFVQHLRLVSRIDGLLEQKTQGPRIQGQVITVIAFLFAIVSRVLFPEEIRPSWTLTLISWTLLGAGAYWVKTELRRASAGLWMADWLAFLARLSAALSWGQTLGPALVHALEDRPPKSWPNSLQTVLQKFTEACRHYEDLPVSTWELGFRDTSSEIVQATEQLRWIHELHQKGQPLVETLDSFVEHALEGLERRLSIAAEKLTVRLLIPLFVCYLPAFLITLFSPILSLVNGA